MKIFLTILAFNLMIIIHELGHFLVAKYFNVFVKEFSLFIGPKIFSKKIGETEYSLRTIPIVAYVKMEGEEEESSSERAFNKKPVWQRALIILAGPLANVISAVVAISIVFMLSGVDTLKVSRVEKGGPADVAGIKVGDQLLEYDNKSTYTPMDFLTYINVKPGLEANIVVDRNGQKTPLKYKPLTNYKYYLIGTEFGDLNSTKITGIRENMPAKNAGLQVGDVVTKIDDKNINKYDELKIIINEKKGEAITVVVNRDGTELPPIVIKPIEQEFKQGVYAGLSFSNEKLPFLKVIKHSFTFAYSNMKNVPYTLKWLITGDIKVTQLMGPVGIVATIGNAASQSENNMELLINLLGSFALISVAIGATNLVPFPALDGNKLVLLFIEAIRRKPLPVEKEAAISFAGLGILMIFAVFVTWADINRVFSGFFNP